MRRFRNPWAHLKSDPDSLPSFSLTNIEDSLTTEEDWKNRDTVRGFGSDTGSVRFAQLLLNASRPESRGDDCDLEAERDYRGIAPGSAEATLLLPGHTFWDDSLL